MSRTTKTLHFKAQPVNDKHVNEARFVAFYPAKERLQATYPAPILYSLPAVTALAISFALLICFALAVYFAPAVCFALAVYFALAVTVPVINRAGVFGIIKSGVLEPERLRFETHDCPPVSKLFNSCLRSLKALFNPWRSVRPLSYKGETYASIN